MPRTLRGTLRAISASDESAAALSMLTGFDLDRARAVTQTEGRIRGQSFTQTPPCPGGHPGAPAGRTTPSVEPRFSRGWGRGERHGRTDDRTDRRNGERP